MKLEKNEEKDIILLTDKNMTNQQKESLIKLFDKLTEEDRNKLIDLAKSWVKYGG